MKLRQVERDGAHFRRDARTCRSALASGRPGVGCIDALRRRDRVWVPRMSSRSASVASSPDRAAPAPCRRRRVRSRCASDPAPRAGRAAMLLASSSRLVQQAVDPVRRCARRECGGSRAQHRHAERHAPDSIRRPPSPATTLGRCTKQSSCTRNRRKSAGPRARRSGPSGRRRGRSGSGLDRRCESVRPAFRPRSLHEIGSPAASRTELLVLADDAHRPRRRGLDQPLVVHDLRGCDARR